MFFFQAEDGIRDLVRSRGLGDVYKRQLSDYMKVNFDYTKNFVEAIEASGEPLEKFTYISSCLLYTSDAADERSSVDLGGRRIINKKTTITSTCLLK